MIIDPWKKRSIEQFKNIFCLKKERKLKFVFPAEKNYECYVIWKKIEDFGTNSTARKREWRVRVLQRINAADIITIPDAHRSCYCWYSVV